MRRSVLITTPYPTPEEVARTYGISKRRAMTLRKLVEESLAKKGYLGKNGSTPSTNGNSAAPKAAGAKKSPATTTVSGKRRAKPRSASRGKLTRGKAKRSH